MGRTLCVVFFVAAAMTFATPSLAAADGEWIDAQRFSWNAPGMRLPPPDAPEGVMDACQYLLRAPETDEDALVARAGWQLFGSYESGWGVTVVGALSSMDGQCRPMGYQHFVFVDGQFAGMIAPEPMDSRWDGAATVVELYAADWVGAWFDRYAPSDPLCCPSGQSYVGFTILQTNFGPVLNPVW
jgi:hypothetical protein